MTRSATVLFTTLALALAACGGEEAPAGQGASGAAPVRSFLVEADVPDAVSVFSAKKKAPGEEVTVVGRVRDLASGFAAFTMIDQVMQYCNQGAEKCGCPTPWDYCCEQAEVVNEASLPVEFRDAKGEPVQAADVGLRLLDLVVVKGKIETTETGGPLLVTASGWHLRERPDLPDGIEWP